PAPCADLLATMPLELRGPLDGMAMTGTFGARARAAIDLAAPPGEGVALDVDLANGCEVTAEPPAADVTLLATARHPDGWLDLEHAPSHVAEAFIAAEDARFFDHHGFDGKQIARSLEIDLRDHKLERGGSTISQQLVKNVYLTQRRSLDRKIQEAVLTWRLEARVGKRTILERYLNLIELGPRVSGVAAAARYWFDETPHDLTLHQAAFLAALTSEPQTMSRRVRHAGGLDPESAARVDVVLRAMRSDGFIDHAELERGRDAGMHFAATALAKDD
ncbi:MAG: transglycosylase domain-containing protein, partial [Acidobacteriota bacterium]